MRSTRPLRLEALEDRTAPTDLGTATLLTAVSNVPPPAPAATAPQNPTPTTTSGAFVGGLMDPNAPNQAPTTPMVPVGGTTTPSPSSLGTLIVPVGTAAPL
jgi:hypothetical protein